VGAYSHPFFLAHSQVSELPTVDIPDVLSVKLQSSLVFLDRPGEDMGVNRAHPV